MRVNVEALGERKRSPNRMKRDGSGAPTPRARASENSAINLNRIRASLRTKGCKGSTTVTSATPQGGTLPGGLFARRFPYHGEG